MRTIVHVQDGKKMTKLCGLGLNPTDAGLLMRRGNY
jgi:hypothetical protein